MEDRIKQTLKELRANENTISMVLGGLVVLVVGILLFNYFRNAPTPELTDEAESTESQEYVLEFEETETGEKTPKDLPKDHTVAAGEDLWDIAEKYYGSGYNWVDIAAANNLNNPDFLAVEQEISIPKVAAKPLTMVVASEAASQEQAISIEGDSYTVQKGDHLWDIAVRAYGDGYQWSKIYEANAGSISNPNLIDIGMELSLPR